MMAAEFQALAQMLTGRLVNTLLEGMAITVVLGVALRMVGRQNAGTRFALWMAALVGIALLPLVAGLQFSSAGVQAYQPAEFHVPGSWAAIVFCLWAAVAGLLLLRIAVGLWKLYKFRAACCEADASQLDPAIVIWLQELRPARRARLCLSNAIAVPSVMGFFRPAIVFPAWLLPGLSNEELKSVLLHEFAHLRRWDDWSNLFQKVMKALFFFHPAVWWIESRLTLEREMACDDMVLAQSASPRAYAASLLSFAEKVHDHRGMALVQALLGRMAQLSQRIAQIVDDDRPRRGSFWKPLVATAGVLGVALFPAARLPRLVSFEAAPPPAVFSQASSSRSPVVQTAAVDAPAKNLARVQYLSFDDRAASVKHRPSVAPRSNEARRNSIAGTKNYQAAKLRNGFVPVAFHPSQFRVQQTVIIVQSQSDAYGQGIWLCIWTVREPAAGGPQLESGIILDSI